MAPARDGYKGVSFHKRSKKWRALIRVEGVQRQLGAFDDPKDAALLYDKEAYRAWGNGCYFNFPELVLRSEQFEAANDNNKPPEPKRSAV